MDCHEGELQVSLLVELAAAEGVAALLGAVQAALPGSSVSIIDRDGLE